MNVDEKLFLATIKCHLIHGNLTEPVIFFSVISECLRNWEEDDRIVLLEKDGVTVDHELSLYFEDIFLHEMFTHGIGECSWKFEGFKTKVERNLAILGPREFLELTKE